MFRISFVALSLIIAVVPLSGWWQADPYAQLIAVHQEFLKIRQLPVVNGLPDYTGAAVAKQKQALDRLRTQLAAIDSSGWPIPRRVDYHLVRAELNGLDYDHRVVRPWARDPGTYVDAISRLPYVTVPIPADRLPQMRAQLSAVPRFLEGARSLLTSPAGELAGIAIRHLSMSDGINQGEPRRAVPPEGVIGWYQDFVERLGQHHPEVAAEARQALSAVEGYLSWLKERQPGMKAPASVGIEDYNWYLRNVRLIPYTADDVRLIGAREEHRARTFLRIEEHTNKGLPAIEPAKSEAEHTGRVREAEQHIRAFMKKHSLMTMPKDAPAEFETDAFWIVRPGGKRHFWEELTYRDPRNNHSHASIPGHQFDALVQRQNANPIRRGYRDGARSEGWGFYIEEMFVQAGLLDELPRAKELFYIAQLKRAIRIPCELEMQAGRFTLQQAIDHMVREVPLMEPDLARYDLAIYLRRPTYGMNYVIGKVQLERLLSERARQLGDKFDLGRFHDEFLAAGPIPISLIQWEMTGSDEPIRGLLSGPSR